MSVPQPQSHLSNVWFAVTPLEVASGHGSWVTTVDGEEYLDFAGGIAVNSTGHAHPVVADVPVRSSLLGADAVAVGAALHARGVLS